MMIVPGSAFMPRQRIAGVDYDPYWANVILLMHLDGNLTDEKGHTTGHGGASNCTFDAAKFGDGLVIQNNSHVVVASNADFAFDADEDYTLEWWANVTNTTPDSDSRHVMNWVESDGPESHLFLFGFNFFSLRYTLNSYVSDALASAPTEFQHWAFVKNGTQCDLYINGNSVIQFTNDVSSKTPAKFYIGCNFAGYTTSEWPGVIDELRITKGIARYTANFTPPTAPFPNE